MIATLIVAVLGSWFSVLPSVSAQPQPPDLATYTGWVREAFAAAQRSDRLGLEDVAGRLVAATSVRLPDNATIAVDNGWLRDALKEAEPDLPAIAARLGAILDALAQPTAAPPRRCSRAAASSMLEQPAVQAARLASQTPAWWTRFWDWARPRARKRLCGRLAGCSPTAAADDRLGDRAASARCCWWA